MFGLLLSLVLTGVIVGGLARAVVPGRQAMSVLATIGLGLVGSIVAGLIAGAIFGTGTGGTIVSLILAVAASAGLLVLAIRKNWVRTT